MVLKKDFLRKKQNGGKLDIKWVGPYTILKVLGKGFYLLQLVENPLLTVKRVCGTHLKSYNSSVPSATPVQSEPLKSPMSASGSEFSPSGSKSPSFVHSTVTSDKQSPGFEEFSSLD